MLVLNCQSAKDISLLLESGGGSVIWFGTSDIKLVLHFLECMLGLCLCRQIDHHSGVPGAWCPALCKYLTPLSYFSTRMAHWGYGSAVLASVVSLWLLFHWRAHVDNTRKQSSSLFPFYFATRSPRIFLEHVQCLAF